MAQQDVTTMRQADAVCNRGDIPGALAAFDPAIKWHEPGGGRAVRGIVHSSRSVADEVVATIPPAVEVLAAEPERFIDAGEHVVAIGCFRGPAQGGRELDAPFAHLWTMHGGRAVRVYNHLEAAPWAEAWGG